MIVKSGSFYVRVEIVDSNNGNVVGRGSCSILSDHEDLLCLEILKSAKAAGSISAEEAFESWSREMRRRI